MTTLLYILFNRLFKSQPCCNDHIHLLELRSCSSMTRGKDLAILKLKSGCFQMIHNGEIFCQKSMFILCLIREEYRVRNGRLLLPIEHAIPQNFLAFGCTGGSETHKFMIHKQSCPDNILQLLC